MTACLHCADTGIKVSNTSPRVRMFCDCVEGAGLRTESNLVTLCAVPPHDACGPIATGPFPDDDLTHETLAQRLTKTAYRAPCAHFCRGCSTELNPEQPCGSYCGKCSDEIAASPEYDPADDRLAIFFYGIAVGLGLVTFAVLMGWVRL